MNIGKQIDKQTYNKSYFQVRSQVFNQASHVISFQMWNQLGDKVFNQASHIISFQMWNQIINQVSNKTNTIRNIEK
jgi:hypothetical protein